MEPNTSAPVILYRPLEVARMLRCSQWWVKEQARRRRIPFCWIGGGYRFTAEHVREITRRFEVQPVEGDPTARPAPARRPAPAQRPVLVARPPRRLQAVIHPDTAAA